MRGAFIRGDGLVIPNNITDFGAQTVLSLALLSGAYAFNVGLCSATYSADMTWDDIVEPTLAINGYTRKSVTRDAAGWPVIGNVNGETYAETDYLEWTAQVGPFDKAITRMFICGDGTQTAGMNIFALSGALPNPVTIGLTTDELLRKFKYRLYLR